jgi:hypothetical protein
MLPVVTRPAKGARTRREAKRSKRRLDSFTRAGRSDERDFRCREREGAKPSSVGERSQHLAAGAQDLQVRFVRSPESVGRPPGGGSGGDAHYASSYVAPAPPGHATRLHVHGRSFLAPSPAGTQTGVLLPWHASSSPWLPSRASPTLDLPSLRPNSGPLPRLPITWRNSHCRPEYLSSLRVRRRDGSSLNAGQNSLRTYQPSQTFSLSSSPMYLPSVRCTHPSLPIPRSSHSASLRHQRASVEHRFYPRTPTFANRKSPDLVLPTSAKQCGPAGVKVANGAPQMDGWHIPCDQRDHNGLSSVRSIASAGWPEKRGVSSL